MMVKINLVRSQTWGEHGNISKTLRTGILSETSKTDLNLVSLAIWSRVISGAWNRHGGSAFLLMLSLGCCLFRSPYRVRRLLLSLFSTALFSAAERGNRPAGLSGHPTYLLSLRLSDLESQPKDLQQIEATVSSFPTIKSTVILHECRDRLLSKCKRAPLGHWSLNKKREAQSVPSRQQNDMLHK